MVSETLSFHRFRNQFKGINQSISKGEALSLYASYAISVPLSWELSACTHFLIAQKDFRDCFVIERSTFYSLHSKYHAVKVPCGISGTLNVGLVGHILHALNILQTVLNFKNTNK